MNKDEYQIIKATLSAFGPDEGVRFAQDTWAKLHAAMSAVVAQPAPVQKPVAQCTNSDTWNCKYCRKTETCEALEDTRNFATPPAAQRQWVGLTDEEENALIPAPDGSAEADVRRVEVLPGAWGKEYEEVDAWSRPLVLQMLRNHEAKLKERNT